MKPLFLYGFAITLLSICAPSSAQPLLQQTDSSQAIADRIVGSDIPVLVDFWAAWCGPCRMLNPIIHDLEKEYAGKALFVKVNVDIHRSLSSYFSVSSIPAVFIIHDKKVVTSMPGVQSKEHYRSALNAVIKNNDKILQPSSPSITPQ